MGFLLFFTLLNETAESFIEQLYLLTLDGYAVQPGSYSKAPQQ